MNPHDEWYYKQRKAGNMLNGLKPDDCIYRVISFIRFLQIFADQKLTLFKPHKWDDPFENFIYSSDAISLDGMPISLAKLRETAFGLCWSLNKENDAMWRIYSHDKNGVKVKTTAGKLFNTYWDTIPDPALKCYIGRVLYRDEKEIQQLVSDPDRTNAIILDRQGIEQAKSFLIKRKEFEHEQEVRLLYTTTPDQPECKIDIFNFAVNPNDLFDEVVFDPRMDKDICDSLVAILKRYGYTNPAYRSSLYQVPHFKVTIKATLK